MGNQYKNKATGEVVTLDGQDALKAVQSGEFEPSDGKITVSGRKGTTGIITPEQAQGNMENLGAADPEAQRALGNRLAQQELYNSPEHAVQSFGMGILSGQTFGLSDFVVGDGDVAAANPGWNLGGNILGSASLALGTGGLGTAELAAKGLSGRVAAEAAQGFAFGVGQGVSNLALSNVPFSAESFAGELVTNGLYGAGIGAVAGGLGFGLEKLGSTMKAGREAAEAAAGQGDTAIAGMAPDEVEAFTTKVAEGFKGAEEAAVNAAKSHQAPVIADDLIYSARLSRQLEEEAEGLVDLKAAGPEYRAIKAAKAKLNKLWGDNPLFDRSGMLDSGGLKRIAGNPEKWQETALALDEYREAATKLNKRTGVFDGSGGLVEVDGVRGAYVVDEETMSQKFVPEPHPKVRAYGRGEVKGSPLAAEVDAAVQEVDVAARAFEGAWGQKKGAALDKVAVDKFLAMPIEKAIPAAQAYSSYMGTLQKFVTKFDDGAAGAKFAAAKGQLDEAFALLKKNPEYSGISGAELIAGMAGVEEIPEVDGPADELLKLYIMSKLVGGKSVIPKGARGRNAIAEWAASGARGSAARMGASAASTLAGGGMMGRMAAGFGSAGGVRIADKMLEMVAGARRVSEVTGAATSRIALATEGLARGAKHSKLVAPTAVALLNSYPFSDNKQKAKNTHEAYRLRMDELANAAANPMGMQQKVHDNLDPVRKVNTMLADHLEVQAVKDAQFLYEKAPKDPGTMTMLGISKWRPSEDDVVRWSNYFRGLDPAGVWERVVGGRVTPQEAEFLRVRRPETFREIQRTIGASLPEIQKNCTYDQRVRMTICFDVPADPLAAKHTVNFVQQQFVDRANGPDGQPVEFKASGNGFTPEDPTKAQRL